MCTVYVRGGRERREGRERAFKNIFLSSWHLSAHRTVFCEEEEGSTVTRALLVFVGPTLSTLVHVFCMNSLRIRVPPSSARLSLYCLLSISFERRASRGGRILERELEKNLCQIRRKEERETKTGEWGWLVGCLLSVLRVCV